MSNNDQQLVDHLYNTIFIQQLRCNHFNSVGQQASNSVWNKHSDEKKILEKLLERYKKYYRSKVEDLKTRLHDLKEVNINSYLTYDTEYYVNEYTKRIDELDNYLVELETKTVDHVAKEKLSSISEAVDEQFPGYLKDPSLLGLLC